MAARAKQEEADHDANAETDKKTPCVHVPWTGQLPAEFSLRAWKSAALPIELRPRRARESTTGADLRRGGRPRARPRQEPLMRFVMRKFRGLDTKLSRVASTHTLTRNLKA